MLYVYSDEYGQAVVDVVGYVSENHHKVPEDFSYQESDREFIRFTGEGESKQFYVDLEARDLALLKIIDEQSKTDAYADYVAGIDQKMVETFGTKNRDKANALYLTWQIMAKSPQGYADEGLVDDAGGALDNETKVFQYAERKLLEAKNYSIYLLKAEQAYKNSL